MSDYHINTINIDIINTLPLHDKIINRYWYVNPIILSRLINKHINHTPIIDVGGGTMNHFPLATHIIDVDTSKENVYKVDIDFEKLPFDNHIFSFAYCRHTLEDIQNPQFAFQELARVARNGYIETPSPLIEILKHVANDETEESGYCHHRYLVWSEIENNTLYFLPKYGLLEYIQSSDFIKRLTFIANQYPVYWNNYYYWDASHPPNVVIYRNGINFNIINDYSTLINRAIMSSLRYTSHFIESICL
jgi:SAM-dependent methyltransferase